MMFQRFLGSNFGHAHLAAIQQDGLLEAIAIHNGPIFLMVRHCSFLDAHLEKGCLSLATKQQVQCVARINWFSLRKQGPKGYIHEASDVRQKLGSSEGGTNYWIGLVPAMNIHNETNRTERRRRLLARSLGRNTRTTAASCRGCHWWG